MDTTLIKSETGALLALIDMARLAIAKASTIGEARKGMATAEGYLEAWKSIGAGEEAIRKATEIVIRWKIRLWQLVEEMRARGEAATKGTNQHSGGAESAPPLTLSDLGIDKHEAKELRLLASLPDDRLGQIFEQQKPLGIGAVIAEARRAGGSNGRSKRAEAPPQFPHFPLSDNFKEWLELIRRRADGIVGLEGGLISLLARPGWDHGEDGVVHPMLKYLADTLAQFEQELRKWRKKKQKIS